MPTPRYSLLLALCPLFCTSCDKETITAIAEVVLDNAPTITRMLSEAPLAFGGEILVEQRISPMAPIHYVQPRRDASVTAFYYVAYPDDPLPGDLNWYDNSLPHYQNNEKLKQIARTQPEKMRRIFEAYQKKADGGNPASMLNTGCCYWMGYGTEENEAQALRYFQMAAQQQSNDYIRHLGFFNVRYVQLLGKKYSFQQCLEEFRSSQGGDNSAAYAYGELLYLLDEKKASTPQEHAAIVKELKAHLNTDTTGSCHYILGLACEKGLMGVPKNAKAALNYYRQAAEAQHDDGYAEAQLALGNIYQFGKRLGQKENPQLALDYYRKAATRRGDNMLDSANRAARANLAVHQLRNPQSAQKLTGLEPGSPQTPLTPAELLRDAAENGNPEAAYNYGVLLFSQSSGTPTQEALSCIHQVMEADGKEADLAATQAAATLYEAFFSGQKGDEAQLAAAVQTLRQDTHNNPSAHLMLANCLATGTGVPCNPSEAFRIYEQYKDSDPVARYNLGLCHEQGAGTARDAAMGAKLKQEAMQKLRQR